MVTPPEVSARDVIERLSRALDGGPAVVAFDGDGTLWRGDVSCDVFGGAVSRAAFREEARASLLGDARELGLDVSGPLEAVAERLLAAHLRGHWEDGPAAIGMATAWAGYTQAEALAFADEILAEARLPERMHPGALEIIAWARANGVRVIVVSASPIAIVYAAVRALEVPDADVVAMRLAIDERGRYRPAIEGINVYGEGKVPALQARCGEARVLGVFGDSAGDRFMLRMAKVPVAVGPTAKLLAEAHTIADLTVLPFPSDPR
jgi:phosphatidylglycerophosphatase C